MLYEYNFVLQFSFYRMNHFNLLTVTGPTASGKTAFAAHLAKLIGGEIISADSRQVYREMNIGTGKDYDDYMVQSTKIPCHLIDIHEPGYKYNVHEFQQDFIKVFDDIKSRGKMPILAGGTGMYIEAVTAGYQLVPVPINEALRKELESKKLEDLGKLLKSMKPELHNNTDLTHKKRTIRAIEIAAHLQNNPVDQIEFPEINNLIFGIKYDRGSRRRRISERLNERLSSGMIEEVEGLLKKVSADDLMYYGLEYKFIAMYLTGVLTKKEMCQKLEVAIHQFAKRQMTWFHRMEKKGIKIHWIDGHLPMEEKLEQVKKILQQNNSCIN